MRILTNLNVDPASIIDRKVDIVFFCSSKNSVMNGDPDRDGNQRVDPTTGKGLVSPVSPKSWIRAMAKLEGKAVYIDRNGPPLASILNEVSGANLPVEAEEPEEKKGKGKGKAQRQPKKATVSKDDVVSMMSSKYIDVRLFGGALTAPVNVQITGPVQFTFGETIDQVIPIEHTITRGCVTREEDEEKERTMGKMPSMGFALFRTHIHVNAFCACRVQTTWQDLDDMLWYLQQSFDQFRSTIRSNNNFVKMIMFVHPDANGKEQCSKLFERVIVKPSDTRKSGEPANSLSDYQIDLNNDGLKTKGIEVLEVA